MPANLANTPIFNEKASPMKSFLVTGTIQPIIKKRLIIHVTRFMFLQILR